MNIMDLLTVISTLITVFMAGFAINEKLNSKK